MNFRSYNRAVQNKAAGVGKELEVFPPGSAELVPERSKEITIAKKIFMKYEVFEGF